MRTRGALHLHVQGVPIPSGEASRGARILMRSEGSRHGMTFEQVCVVCVCVCLCVCVTVPEVMMGVMIGVMMGGVTGRTVKAFSGTL